MREFSVDEFQRDNEIDGRRGRRTHGAEIQNPRSPPRPSVCGIHQLSLIHQIFEIFREYSQYSCLWNWGAHRLSRRALLVGGLHHSTTARIGNGLPDLRGLGGSA